MDGKRVVEAIEALIKDNAATRASLTSLGQQMRGLVSAMQVRENAHHDLTIDTNSAGVTAFDVYSLFGHVSGTSLEIVSVGGGSLECAINGGRFRAVSAGDVWENESINRLQFRTTTQAAGTAVARVGAFVPGTV